MDFGAFYLQDTVGRPEQARWLHLAHSGSQSQRAIWFILPARGASCIIINVNNDNNNNSYCSNFCSNNNDNNDNNNNNIYYIKVSGIVSGNKLIKTIQYPHM